MGSDGPKESCVLWVSRGADERCHGNIFGFRWIIFGCMIASDTLFDRCGLLANVNSKGHSERCTFAICCRTSVCLSSVCLSYVVCNVRAPYSGGSNFRQYFYGIRYLGHPLTSIENFTEIVPRGTPPPGELNTRVVAKYSDFGPIDGYIWETVQDRR